MEVWEIGIYMNTKKVMVTEITRAVPRPKKWRFKFLNAEEKTHSFQSCHIAFSS